VLVPGQKYPDTSVEKLTISPSLPKVGDKVTISATIANNGTGDASNVQVKFSIDSTSIGTQTIVNLAAQDTKTVSVSWTADKEGVRVAKAEAMVTGDPNTANDVGTLSFSVSKSTSGGNTNPTNDLMTGMIWLIPAIPAVVVVVVLLMYFRKRRKDRERAMQQWQYGQQYGNYEGDKRWQY
jgi:uncharacterized repeat protein (TIGR01451 family)